MSGWWQLLTGLPLAAEVVILSYYDLRAGILPDRLVSILAALGVMRICWYGSWKEAIFGVLLGGGLLLLLRLLSRGGMGGGDVQFSAALGLWLGPPGILLTLLLAFVAGGLVAAVMLLSGTRRRSLPFGPFLGVAGWLAYLYGSAWLNWYGIWL